MNIPLATIFEVAIVNQVRTKSATKRRLHLNDERIQSVDLQARSGL